MNNRPPCGVWAEKLALRREDLTSSERVALDAHVTTCRVCQQAQADYDALDTTLRALPLSTMKHAHACSRCWMLLLSLLSLHG